MKNDVLIIGAMKMEVSGIEGAVCTGFGKEKTKKTLSDVVLKRKPSLVIMTGLCGALIPELKIGDIVVPEKIIDYECRDVRFGRLSFECLALEHLALVRSHGTMITVPKVFEKEHKYDLKKDFPEAACVDMEASGAMEVLEEMNIPFICVKAVSDELDFDFSDKKNLKTNIDSAVARSKEFVCQMIQRLR